MPFLPVEASAEAGRVDGITLVVLGICAVLALGVFASMAFFLIRYREGNLGVSRSHPPRTSWSLELGWTVAAVLLGLVMFRIGAEGYYSLYAEPARTDLTLEVVGKQWMWVVRYPNGYQAFNQIHLPRGRPVRLRTISQDVIHSLFLPEFRLKHDVLPGRYTELGLTADREGTFQLVCSEFCGTLHSDMRGQVIVQSPAEFRAWLSGTRPVADDPVLRGRRLFERYGCASCHGFNALGEPLRSGPRLNGLLGRKVALQDGTVVTVDEQYLRDSIMFPARQVLAGYDPIMPAYDGRLSEQDMLDLLAYLRDE